MLLGVPALFLLALVANVLPLERIVPKTVVVTGPVRADAFAVFWIGVFLLVGAIAGTQGLHQLRRGRFSARLLFSMLGVGALLLIAGLAARTPP